MGGLSGVIFFAVTLTLFIQLIAIEPLKMIEMNLSILFYEDNLYDQNKDIPNIVIEKPITIYIDSNNHVKFIIFNATNVGDGKIPIKNFDQISLILEYDMIKVVSNEKELKRYATWLPFDPKAPINITSWTIQSIYYDKFEPINVELNSGAWNSGEVIEIRVQFSSKDEPYWNDNEGLGHFYIYFNPPCGYSSAYSIKSVKKVIL